MTKRNDYVEQAMQTCSPDFHTDKVSVVQFITVLRRCINALEQLDAVKKSLFYGRDHSILPPDPHTSANEYNRLLTLLTYDGINASGGAQIVHGIIGLATEAGELLEALEKAINIAKPIDFVNLKEEVGDGKWYMAILADVAGFAWGDDEDVNIVKLRKRFPHKFTQYDANNRDINAERKVLEGDDHIGEAGE